MFLPWSIFIINNVLAVFSFLLGLALDSLLGLYVRCGGEYAYSILWTHQGGHMEAITSLYNSRNIVPSRTKVWVVMVIVASLVVSYLDKLVVKFIEENATQEVELLPIIVKTQQFPDFSAWSAYVHSWDNVVTVAQTMINDTRNIPDAIDGKMYKPKMFGYEGACDELSIGMRYFVTQKERILPLSTKHGCMNVELTIIDHLAVTWDFGNTTVSGTDNRWRLTTPVNFTNGPEIVEIGLFLEVNACYMRGVTRIADTVGGMISPPTTTTTKCSSRDGRLTVLSISEAHFSPHLADDDFPLNATVTVTFGDNELIQSMIASANTTFKTPTLAVEIKIVGTSIDMLACYSTTRLLSCTYATFDVIIAKPRPKYPGLPSIEILSPKLLIYHIPETKDGWTYFPVSRMRNASLEMVHYFATLGENFGLDYMAGELYMLYDVYDTKKGVDAPEWLVTSVIITMTLCFLVWMLITLQLDSKYSDSLYGTISSQMATRTGETVPMLMKFSEMELKKVRLEVVDEKDTQSDEDKLVRLEE